MTHSVVLLNGETGGFIVVDGSIKPIPKLGDGLRRHLLAVNTLAQALGGGDDLDSDHGELEALVVQAANLVLRRLQRSAGIEALEPVAVVAVVAEPEQIAEPHENADSTTSGEPVTETAAEGTAETVVAESSKPVQAEQIINGEHAEPAVEAVAHGEEAIEASSAVEPEGNTEGNPGQNLEPIHAPEGESAHSIEASS
jgi:hypothetical protein